MAPPFSPDDDQDDVDGDIQSPTRGSMPSTPPTASFPRNLSTSGSSSYEDNVLTNSSDLFHRSSRTGKSKKSDSRIRSSQTADEQDDNENDEEDFRRQRKINKVAVEIPLILSMPTGEKQEKADTEMSEPSTTTNSRALIPQLQLSQNVLLSLDSFVPPSSPDSRWSGDVHGRSKVNQLVGSTNGSCNIAYKYNSQMRLLGNLNLLSTANHTRPFQIGLGAKYQESSTSTVQISLQQQEENRWGINLSTRDVVDPWILHSTLWWNPRKGQWRSTVAATSMTTHRVRFAIGMKNLDDPILTNNESAVPTTIWYYMPSLTWQINLDPKLSSTRRLPMILQYYPDKGLWNASVALHTTKPTAPKNGTSKEEKNQQPKAVTSSWQVGLRGGATLASGWSILLAWTHGDITLRIPILLSTTLLASMTNDNKKETKAQESKLFVAATPLLVLAISGVAQELLARFLWSNNAALTNGSNNNNTTRSPSEAIAMTKVRQDAQSQQDLMKRQAENRKAIEAEKNGLVIQSATYELKDIISWDVTIPLQFWVSPDTSTLSLAAEESKQHLLGFYCLTEPNKEKQGSNDSCEETNAQQTEKAASPKIPWWKEFWTPTTKRSLRPKAPKDVGAAKQQLNPTLTVKYSFQGKSYKVTIHDQEGLQLPQKSESEARNE